MLNAVRHLKGEGGNALHRQRRILFNCEEVIMTRNINEQMLQIVSDFNSVLEDISVAVTKLPKNVCFVCSGGCLTHVFSRCLCSMTHRFSPLRLPLVDRVIVGHSRPHRVRVPVFVCLHGM